MAEKITVSDVTSDAKAMKKIEHLPKAEQTKWIKTYVGAFDHAITKEKLSTAKAKEYAARTAWDKVPAKFLEKPTKVHGPGKSKKPLAAYKEAFLKDTDELVKIANVEELAQLPTSELDGFLMWMKANNLKFAKETEVTKEFSPEEQEFLKTVTGYSVETDPKGFTLCLHGPEGPEAENVIEINVTEEDTLEEEMEEEVSELAEEGIK